MGTILEFLRRMRFLFQGSRFDRDLAEEMRLHIDLRAANKRDGGLDRALSQASARRQFGNVTQMQEASREAWAFAFLETLLQDLRYGLRNLASNPGFTVTAVLSLALGIGANTAIFSIINTLMLRSLPVADPQALVQITLGPRDDSFNTPIWEQVRDHQQAFAGVLAYSADRFDLADGGESHYAQGIWASGSFFSVLGVPAIRGRTFTAQDDRWGGGPEGAIAVISYDFWQSQFAGDRNVIGKTVHVNRHPFTIVGVTPPWFTGLDVDRGYDIAIPIGTTPMFHGSGPPPKELQHWWLRLIGRLAPGQSLEQANDRMRAIAPEIFKATLPPWMTHDQEDYLNSQFLLTPAGLGFSQTRVQYRTALLALMATVALVLLIACANIANLLLARASARQRELSVRMAIGAGRPRLIRQLVTESLLLALLGAAGGFLLAAWGSSALFRLLSTSRNPLDLGFSPDIRLLAFTMGSAILTALLFGLAPAFRATRGLNHALKENERGTLHGSSRFHLGKTLVSGQVALSLVLLVGAGLFLGSLRNLLTVDPGFNRHNILLVGTTLRNTTSSEQRLATYREILGRLGSLPGVVSAANAMLTPINPAGWAQPVFPEGYSPTSRRDNMVFFNRVSAGYFRTMRTPVVMGREFNERDTLSAPLAIIINETAARHFFATSNPVGRSIGLEKRGQLGSMEEKELYQVVGVVKDTRYNRINEPQKAIAYLASEQDIRPGAELRFAVQTRGPVEAVIPSVRAAISGIDPAITLEFGNFETQVADSLLQPRLVATLSAIFGALALILAMVGLYGVTSYSVARRKSEIGIRIALGAQRRAVVWLMLRDVVMLLSIGLALGLGASLALGRLVTSLLYGLEPNAPAQLAGAAAVLAIATAVAAWLPARRAATLDPMVALREE